MKQILFLLMVVFCVFAAACGTVGDLASPTPVATVSMSTPTPTFTDEAKSAIMALFNRQAESLNTGDWQSVFQTCSPSYRSRRNVARFTEDVQRYLVRFETTPDELDVRNPVVTKGRDDRFDMNYDLYINGEFSETVRVGGAYIQVQGVWYDDGVWCR